MQPESRQVLQYLREHPEFFDTHAEALAEIFVPHPHGGRAIPIAERQMVTLRDKNRALEDKLLELVQYGQENDAIIARLHRLALAVMDARSLDALLAALYFNLREDFAVPHVALRLWAEGALSHPEFGPLSPEARVFAESLAAPYISHHAMFESALWFGEDDLPLHSFAYVGLGVQQPFGMLVLASEDERRFYPEMGTVHLQRLGELASAALARWLRP
jgi:uncharacterized protein YigA (DUF484 family)